MTVFEVVSERDSVEVGELVRRRRESLGLTQEGIPGISSALVGKIERGVAGAGRTLNRVALTRALHWPDDALDRLARGDDLDLINDLGSPLSEDPVAREMRLLREELAALRAELRKRGSNLS